MIDCATWWALIRGMGDRFHPSALVTRGQIASLAVRLIERTGGPTPAASTDHFADDNGSVHETAINALTEAGVLRGMGNAIFRPNDSLTRAQAATGIARCLDLLVDSGLGWPPT